jgi:hypothetical protein
MTDDEIKKILFVLIMMKNKMKDDSESVEYLDEAIGYIEKHFEIE